MDGNERSLQSVTLATTKKKSGYFKCDLPDKMADDSDFVVFILLLIRLKDFFFHFVPLSTHCIALSTHCIVPAQFQCGLSILVENYKMLLASSCY